MSTAGSAKTKKLTVAELGNVLALEIGNILRGHGYIGMTLSINVAEPDGRVQITFRPKSILVKKVPGEGVTR